MPKILSYGSSGEDVKVPGENPLKKGWEWFRSLDRLTKSSFLTVILILAATPFIVNNLLETRQRAAGPDPLQIDLPKTGEEQILIKVKKEAYSSKEKGINDEDTVRKISSKHGEVKKVRREFLRDKEAFRKKGKSLPTILDDTYSIQFEDRLRLKETFNKLKNDKLVENVQWNYLYEADAIPNDPQFGQQYSHTKAQASLAWDITTGSENVTIAIIGTGVKWDHPDLASNIWSNTQEIASNGIDDDLNGFIDDIRGWNFYSNNNNPQDTDGHETSVAGVAAAVGNNGTGIAGVCWKCKIMPLKISYTTTSVASAINYSVANRAKVINMSFGSYDPYKYGPDSVVESVVDNAIANEVLVVATAGNNSISDKRFPGALENVIGTASTDSNDNRSAFSNYGEWVDVAAPGTSVMSTTLSGGYGGVSGTSFSAPYIAGMGGLIFSRTPNLSLSEAKLILEYHSDKILADKYIGSGRANAFKTTSNLSKPSPYGIIKSPSNSSVVMDSGTTDLRGTVFGDSYKIEIKGSNETEWRLVLNGSGERINSSLGVLNGTSLADAINDLKITVNKNGQEYSDIIKIIKGGGFQSGFPLNLGGGAILSPANVYDVDGNGDLEIIIGSDSGKLYILNHDGTIFPGWPQTAFSSYIFANPVVGDIDGDGQVEIVVATYGLSGAGHLHAYEITGQQISGFPKAGGSRGEVVLANMDGDSALEIIAGLQGGSFGGQAQVLNGDATAVPGWPITLPETNFQTAPSIYEKNDQSYLAFTTWRNTKTVNKDGTQIGQWAKENSHVSPVLVDIDHDTEPELIQGEGLYLRARELNGQLIWEKNVGTPMSYSSVVIGDVTADGVPEIILTRHKEVNQTTSAVHVFDFNGNQLTNWPKVSSEGLEKASIGDINGDGKNDIVVATYEGLIYGWDAQGNILPNFPKATGSTLYVAPTIADIDSDGDNEMIVGAANGEVYVWNLVAGSRNSEYAWPFSRLNNTNTGAVYRTAPPPPPTLPPDITQPSISVTSPVLSKIDQGAIVVRVNAQDNVGVNKIEYLVDGQLVSTGNSQTFSWDTSAYLIGSRHSIQVKAYDAAGNSASTSVTNYTIISDPDHDAYSSEIENYIGTNPNLACGAGAWPPDFDNNGIANTIDAGSFTRVLNSREGDGRYNPRYDLDANRIINTADVGHLVLVLNKTCASINY